MTSDLDIYRYAHDIIHQHGEAADIEAAMRACMDRSPGPPLPLKEQTIR